MEPASASLCACSQSWQTTRREFREILTNKTRVQDIQRNFPRICRDMWWRVLRAGHHMQVLFTGSHEASLDFLEGMKQRVGGCLPAVTLAAYACVLSSWFEDDDQSRHTAMNIALPLFAYTARCLEPGLPGWGISATRALEHLQEMTYSDTVRLKPGPLLLCQPDALSKEKSFAGYCGPTFPERVRLGVIGPVDPILARADVADVVLCTHTSSADLGLVEPMLTAWGGPVSIAVLEEVVEGSLDKTDFKALVTLWVEQRLAKELSLRHVVVSLVNSLKPPPVSGYDNVYPANILRQAALDAAVGDLVLLADPAFIPSAGFARAVAAASPLGGAIRAMLASAPTAFLVASFLTFDDSVPDVLDVATLRELVDVGSAVAFDAHMCPLCKPHAWQWVLLTAPPFLRFHEVEAADLHHPAWLVSKSVLPRLPSFLHGVVGPRTKSKDKFGWTGLPGGLRASAEQLRAQQVRLLLLPDLFLHRRASLRTPSRADELHPEEFPMATFTVIYRHFVARLSRANRSTVTGSGAQRGLLWGSQQLLEVAPSRHPRLLKLQEGSDASLELIVVASIVAGSSELQRFVASVPWTVHAISVGARDFWGAAKADLPEALRIFPPGTLVAIVDAYDVVFFPCGRSIRDEFRALKKDIVISAELLCWPNATLCRTCDERYASGSEDHKACQHFPFLNSGGFMGSAEALADAFDWMNQRGPSIGVDDQENAWHFYNAFPERVALDHRQRIWSTMLFCNRSSFRVENCSVISDYIGGTVCFGHGNGGARRDILAPILRELEDAKCRKPPAPRKVNAYFGLSQIPS
eukprot:TRINITY_DN37347_c0_g1_i1.p1 TRINITY_DN37347_c0_g1~~TRINITY_DN37347_c0_g1_i1.p1  ORF type:complete len:828 (-),score=103.45 TRINITY_DN37347_c0_g1_i1:53-2476(-)